MKFHREVLVAHEDGSLSFGDFNLTHKAKVDDFEFQGDVYKLRTCNVVTKLDKNDMFIYESVPGSAVEMYRATEEEVCFSVAAANDIQITLELEPEQAYEVFVNDMLMGKMVTHLNGKLTVGIEINPHEHANVRVAKC